MLLMAGGYDQLAWPVWHADPLFAPTDTSDVDMMVNQPMVYLNHPTADHMHVVDYELLNLFDINGINIPQNWNPFEHWAGYDSKDTFLPAITAWMYAHLRDYKPARDFFSPQHSAFEQLENFGGTDWDVKTRGPAYYHEPFDREKRMSMRRTASYNVATW
jgi:hypothetical protein